MRNYLGTSPTFLAIFEGVIKGLSGLENYIFGGRGLISILFQIFQQGVNLSEVIMRTLVP